MIYEFRCLRCGEHFVDAEDEDPIHYLKQDGTECRGRSEPSGVYAQNAQEARNLFDDGAK